MATWVTALWGHKTAARVDERRGVTTPPSFSRSGIGGQTPGATGPLTSGDVQGMTPPQHDRKAGRG